MLKKYVGSNGKDWNVKLPLVLMAWAQVNLEASARGRKACYDRKTSNREYEVGDKVFYFKFAKPVGTSKKFHPSWLGYPR